MEMHKSLNEVCPTAGDCVYQEEIPLAKSKCPSMYGTPSQAAVTIMLPDDL
jgi:hypothetical protein